MISDEKIQADLIAKIRTLSTVVAALPNVNEIREFYWQGDEFAYPNIRLDLESNDYVFDEQAGCSLWEIEFSLYVFSEERSSKQCSTIKGLLENALTGQGWHGTYAKYTRLRLQENIPAVRQDERTWRSQLRYLTRVQNLP